MRQYIFLLLALMGLFATWYFNIQWIFSGEEVSLVKFVELNSENLPAKSIAVDISWVLILLTLIIALAFTFPMYLYIRERKLLNIN